VPGYFKKGENIEDQSERLKLIINYLADCLHPMMDSKT